MKHRILSLLLALAMLLVPFGCCAESGDFEFGLFEDDHSHIYRYTGSASDLVIPSSLCKYDEYWPVGSIQDEAFIYNTALKTVVIPEGVTYIGSRAFYGCENLTRVVLPSTLDSIGDEAFANCVNLTDINMPAELYNAGQDVFAGCDNLNLSARQQNALTDTAVAQHMAEQEAFVVDTGNLVELSGVLGTKLDRIPELFPGAEEADYSDGPAYSLNPVLFSAFGAWTVVDGIDIGEKCNYSILGIYITMDEKDVTSALLRSGWKITEKAKNRINFSDPNGNAFCCWLDDDGKADGITIEVNFDIACGIRDGICSVSDIFAYSAAQQSGASAARTTSEVNMRAGAGLNFDTIGSIPADATVEYLGEEEIDSRGVAWYHVRYNGKDGWCSSKYVELP